MRAEHSTSVDASGFIAPRLHRLPRPMPTWLRLTLIVYLVGGGFDGLALTINAIFGGHLSVSTACIYSVFAALCASGVAGGLVMVVRPARLTLPCALLLLQIPVFCSPIFCYEFALFAYVGAGFNDNSWLFFSARLGTQWTFLYSMAVPWSIGINFLPIALLLMIVGGYVNGLGISSSR